jgi:hypothetical protein
MKARSLLVLIFIVLAISSPVKSEDLPVTNDSFVKNSFLDLAEKLLGEYSFIDPVNLIFKCADCPADFFTNLITVVLKQKETILYIDNKELDLNKLEVHLYSSDFYYEKNGGSLFSSGQLERKLDISAFAVLLNSSGQVLWQNEHEDKYTEKIDWQTARNWKNHSKGMFDAPIPSTRRSRLWEPVVISSLLGGLVYLFFASR